MQIHDGVSFDGAALGTLPEPVAVKLMMAMRMEPLTALN
jgi:hypothetical protein